MITISLCMIVKNEEKVLPRCLDSLKDLVEEMIIVDTGSTDSTMEIARGYGALVYQYAWDGNFANARNYSFSKATKSYIYCADADEILDEVNQKRFLDLKKAMLPEIEIVQMMYCNQLSHNTVYNFDREYRPKLFKRIRQFVWVEPIHETITLEPLIYDSEIEIVHMPLSNHAGRDFQAFTSMVGTCRLSQRLHHMYAQELYIAGAPEDFFTALPVFQDSMTDINRSQEEKMEACCVIARVSRLSGDMNSFFTHVLKNIVCGSCSEICYELGEYYEERKEWEEAAIWYQNAAYETECILFLPYQNELPLLGLARCFHALGKPQQAGEYEALAASRQKL